MHMMKVVQRPRENGKKKAADRIFGLLPEDRGQEFASCGKSSKLIRLRSKNMPIFSIIFSLFAE